MADEGTSWGVIFAIIILFIWLIVITILLVAAFYGKVSIAPTGPTGPTGPPPGPTGPTGPTGGSPSPNVTFTPGTVSVVNPNGFIGAVGSSASSTCQFNNNGSIDNVQIIYGSNPQIIKWALSNNSITFDYNNGVFVLPVGTYVLSNINLSTSVTYLASQNTGGTYRTIAAWLRTDTGNQVNESDLLGITSAISINGLATTLTFPSSLQFTVTSIRNKFSILTWHDSVNNLMIGCAGDKLTRFNLIKIA